MSRKPRAEAVRRPTSAARRLPPTQLGVHAADAHTTDVLAVHAAGHGLIVGVNEHGGPVTIMLFRPEPTAAVVMGGVRLAQLIAFRALAIGAHVLVQTDRPHAWATFAGDCDLDWGNGAAAAGLHHESPAGSYEPRLVIVDTDATADAAPSPMRAWSTVLTVRSHISGWDTAVLGRADVALLQRLSPDEANVAAAVINVPEFEQENGDLADDMVALVSHGQLRVVRIAQTTTEHRMIGPVGRSFQAAQDTGQP